MHTTEPMLSAASSITSPDPVAGSAGPTSIVFGSGVPDSALYPRAQLEREISRVLREQHLDLGYSRGRGQPALRAAVAGLLSGRSGSVLTGDDVVITGGASGALQAAAAALLDPGDVIVTDRHTYPAAVDTFRHHGATVVGVPGDGDGVDIAAVDAAVRVAAAAGRRVKAIYTIAPYQSPTTATLSAARAAALVAVAEQHDTVVVLDDTYGEIRFGDRSALHPVLLSSGRVVHIGSFSKTLSPALRLGWLAGNRRVVEAVAAMRTDLGVSLILQEAVARLIESGEYAELVATASRHYRRKRDVLMDVLEQGSAGTATWTVPDGSLFLWLAVAPTTDRLAVAARERDVGFIPGSVFAVDGDDPHHVRLAYGFVGLDRLADGARRFAESLVSASRRSEVSTSGTVDG